MELENMKFKESGMKIIAAGFLSLALIGNAWAGQVTGLKTFVPATPALAAEVNANFTSVGVAVNDNDTRITANTQVSNANTNAIATNAKSLASSGGVHIVDAKGVLVAKFLQMDTYGAAIAVAQTNFRGISNKGYLIKENFNWTPFSGSAYISSNVIYSDAACTTPKYFLTYGAISSLELKQGLVMLKDANTKTSPHYIAKGSVPTVPTVIANLFRYSDPWSLNGSVCTSLSTTLTNQGVVNATPKMVNLLPNNPLVTGVPANLLFPLGLK